VIIGVLPFFSMVSRGRPKCRRNPLRQALRGLPA